ncbi:MAG: Rv1733c family protein [Trebonia sp.]
MRLKKTPSLRGRWLCRAVRGARPDRNPLRRRTDRLETYLLVGLFAAAVAGAPFAAKAASHAAYLNALHVQQEQLASRHQVSAVLAQDAAPASGYTLSVNVLTQANWTSVTGVRRSGEVPAPPGSLAGTPVTVWTDNASGYLDSPPLTAAEVASQADAAMVGAIAGVAIVYLAGTGTIRQLLNRRRMAAWDADWVATAPTWNRQRW